MFTPITLTLSAEELSSVQQHAETWQTSLESAAARLLTRGLSALAGSKAGGTAAGATDPAGRADRARAAAVARWRRQIKVSPDRMSRTAQSKI